MCERTWKISRYSKYDGRAGYQIRRNELPCAKSPIVRDIIGDCAVSFQCSNRAYLIPEWHATLLCKRWLGAGTWFPPQKAGAVREKERFERKRDGLSLLAATRTIR